MAKKNENSSILAITDFPLYCIQLLTCRHIVVAGGGGASNSGVPNAFEFYELTHNGKGCCAENILRYDTGKDAVMNFRICTKKSYNYLVAGLDGYCQLYKIKFKFHEPSQQAEDEIEKQNGNIRNRKSKQQKKTSVDNFPYNKTISFEVLSENNIQTDFGKDPRQKVAKLNKQGDLLVTGGNDGHIRGWNFPSFSLKFDIKAHKTTIFDLDFSPDDKQLVSVSNTGVPIIWNVLKSEKELELKSEPKNGNKFTYRRCRYAVLNEDSSKSCIFTIRNPPLIQAWNSANGVLLKQTRYNEDLSVLSVRNDGKFLAVGTMISGSVIIYATFSLQILLKIPNAHSTFVTDLEFLPVPLSPEEVSFTTDSEASVVSISPDNKIYIHNLPYRDTIPLWIFFISIFVVILVTFAVCNYIDL